MAIIRPVAVGFSLLAGALVGCSDPISTGGPPGPDLTSIPAAITALEDAYSFRRADEAISFLAGPYRFVPAFPDSIHFLGPGETEWDRNRESVILQDLLVEERTSWIDQVLLEFTVIQADTMNDGSVEVTTKADLDISVTNDQLDKSRAQIVLVYKANDDGLWFLHEERETAWPGWTEKSVGQLKSEVLLGP